MKWKIIILLVLLNTFTWAKINTIIIDAGHGGKDPGAIEKSLGLKEKHVNLAIAKSLHSLIKTKLPWIKVKMTRTNDKYISLDDRVKITDKVSGKNAIFVSIHTNSHNAFVKKQGVEVFYYGGKNCKIENYRKKCIQKNYVDKFSNLLRNPITKMIDEKIKKDSKGLAEFVAKGLKLASKEPIRRIYPSSFFVVAYQKVPAILVEVGFISSKKFLSSYYQKKIAKGVLLGLLSFIKSNSRF